MLVEYEASIVTDAEGDATAYLGTRINGIVRAIKVDVGESSSLPCVMSGETSGVPVMTKTFTAEEWLYPRAIANKVDDGSPLSAVVEIPLFHERMKVVVEGGTASKTSTITLYVDEP